MVSSFSRHAYTLQFVAFFWGFCVFFSLLCQAAMPLDRTHDISHMVSSPVPERLMYLAHEGELDSATEG